jgi:hypothetical protein
VIRLFGFLTMAAITAGGFLFIDYRMSAQVALRDGGESPTISAYLAGLSDRLVGLTTASAASGLPANLSGMLPKAPEGWTVRPVAAADVEQFLPTSKRKADKTAVRLIEDMALATGEVGTEVAALAYENGDRIVLVRAIRYPDAIFTDATALDQRVELQAKGPELRGTEFMTVRGLDVTEDLLPKDLRGRYFLADVGAQIHLRVLAPKRMKDAELLAFFETLHVQAMNASVVDRVDGLGDAPVIVVASALDDAGRDAYVTAVAARQLEEAQRHEAGRLAAEAEVAAQGSNQGQTATLDQGSLFTSVISGLFGKDESGMSAEEPVDHQAALMEAAKSGDGAAAALHAGAVYGAIAEEIGTAEARFVSKSGSGSSIGTPTNKSKIKVGTGNCTEKDGRKICSVGGSE